MDALDTILFDAWNRISKRVRENRVSALKRSRRRFKGVLTRPMREWCLVIRASDTRITAGNALIETAQLLDAGDHPHPSPLPTTKGEGEKRHPHPSPLPPPGMGEGE